MDKDLHSKPTYENQLWHARKLLAEKGREALNNPHAMIGRTCGCGTCFCCAAAEVVADHDRHRKLADMEVRSMGLALPDDK